MDEVTAVLASMGFRASPEYISDIFRQVDLDGNLLHCPYSSSVLSSTFYFLLSAHLFVAFCHIAYFLLYF